MFKKILNYIAAHKAIAVVLVIVLGGGVYWTIHAAGQPSTEVRYVVAAAQKGALISTVSGSGQVAAASQIDIKPKVSGVVLSVVPVTNAEVKANTVLATIDAREGQKQVRDAQVNYASAVLALDKIKKGPDAYSLLQAQNAVTSAKNALAKLQKTADSSSVLQSENTLHNAQDTLAKLVASQPQDLQDAQDAKQKSDDNVAKAYEDAFNEISNTFLDLPTVISDVDGILHNNDISSNEDNSTALVNAVDVADRGSMQVFQSSAEDDYRKARTQYDKNFSNFKRATRYSDRSTVESLLADTIETTKQIAQAAKSESNYMDAWVDYRTLKKDTIYAQVKTNQTKASSDTSKMNSHLSSLLTIQRSLKDYNQAVVTAQSNLSQLQKNQPLDLAAASASVNEKQAALDKLKSGADSIDVSNAKIAIAEKEAALKKLKDGADPLDIRTQQLAVSQRANALADAKAALADYQIKTPFDAMIASIPVKVGDSVSASTTIATVITKQKIAEISLNEVDAAKIQVGDKTTLTFDAVDGLQVTGQVAQIDSLGTVTQGVVSYTAKIIFDTQDARIKPGMSTSAAIITDSKQDVIVVDNSAIKTQGDTHVVEVITSDMIKEQSDQGVTLTSVPLERTVTIGISNDTSTEIVEGISEGDQVIIRTVRPASATSATQAPSLLGSPAGGRGATGAGGGTFRATTR